MKHKRTYRDRERAEERRKTSAVHCNGNTTKPMSVLQYANDSEHLCFLIYIVKNRIIVL